MPNESDFIYEDYSEATIMYGVLAYSSPNVAQTMHLHSQVEFMIAESGEASVIINGRDHIVREGNGMLISPHVIHRIRLSTPGSRISSFIFSTDFISDFKGFFESANVPYVRFDREKSPEFATAQAKFLIEFAHNYSFGKTVVKGMLTVLLSGIMPAYTGVEFERIGARSSNFEICRQMLLYIDSNISQDLSLERISKALNIVPSYVSTVFSRNFNTSLNSYINKKRISVAKAMLQNTSKSITEIAFESGFSSIRSFNRRFKESEWLTPSEFRDSFMDTQSKSGD